MVNVDNKNFDFIEKANLIYRFALNVENDMPDINKIEIEEIHE